MNRTKEDILAEMQQCGAMMRTKMTAKELLSGLQDYQAMILRLVFNDDHAEKLRLYDVVTHFKELAKEKGYEEEPVVLQAIRDMEGIAKEIAIMISGVSGERQVERSLNYVHRKMIALPNIHLSDEEEKTEIDQIVITANGILLLEVKSYKKDITISEAGQIYGPCHKHYSDKSLGEQMNVKRYLLRTKLEKALAQVAPEIDVHVESYVVFSNPDITVTDLYKQENYCFKTNLPHLIDDFRSDVYYSSEQMNIIAGAVREIADTDDTYEVGMDFDAIRANFAQALSLLEGEPATVEEKNDESGPEAVGSVSSVSNIGAAAIIRSGIRQMAVTALAAALGTVVALAFRRKA